MAELREISFTHERVFAHPDIPDSGLVIAMSYDGHAAAVRWAENGDVWVTCSCQPDIPWRHHPGQTNKDILQTFNAHLSFATRMKTRVD